MEEPPLPGDPPRSEAFSAFREAFRLSYHWKKPAPSSLKVGNGVGMLVGNKFSSEVLILQSEAHGKQ